MSIYIINGGNPLTGMVQVSGSKNAALPMLCAALLADDGDVILDNCPDISDVRCTLDMLSELGCDYVFKNGTAKINADNAQFCELGSNFTSHLRSAALFLGACLAKFAKSCQALPGGCVLGPRPIDMHLSAFEKMGVAVTLDDLRINCNGSPHATDIFLEYPSVGATENIILASVKSNGTTTITGAAKEPEIIDFVQLLNCMGAKIYGAGTNVIVINGVKSLHGTRYTVMGDRIEAATFLAAAMATDGEVTVGGINPTCLLAVCDVIINSGGCVCRKNNTVSVKRAGPLILSPGTVVTAPYPAFPTDMQSVICAMLLTALGTTKICETVFSDRFRVISDFNRMGAAITVSGDIATVRGVKNLRATDVCACDLRSGAALVVAGLSAVGTTTVSGVNLIERGYQNFETKLQSLGADIVKTEELKWNKKTIR